ncbi:hypothetical protein Tco_0173772 [Tanacetum coccineum]
MEVPDVMISDAIKKKAVYTFYMAKKVEIANVPNNLKKDVVPRKIRSLTITEETVVGELAHSISIQEPRSQRCRRSQLIIESQTDEAIANMYNVWGQKLKGEASSDAYNKHYADSNSDATLYSSSSDKQEKSANETDDADEPDMDLSDDNLYGDDDVAGKENSLSYNNSPNKLTPRQSKKANAKGEKNMRNINFKKAVAQKSREYDQKLEALTNFNVFEAFEKQSLNAQDAEPSFHKRSHNNQDSPNNREGENKKKRATKRKTTWFDLLLKSDIDNSENHILGPSTMAIEKKLKAIIQKDELTIADLKEKYTTSITKHYAARYHIHGIEDMILDRWCKETQCYIFEALNGIHHWDGDRIDFFKAEMSTITEGIVYSDFRIKSVVRVVVKKKRGYGFLTSIIVRRSMIKSMNSAMQIFLDSA